MPSLFTQGSVDPSGVDTDVAIMQDGFFVVQKAGIVTYTRAGNFTKDDSGYLMTVEGQQVLGYPAVNGVVDTGQGLTGLNLGTGAVSRPHHHQPANPCEPGRNRADRCAFSGHDYGI